LLIRHVLSAFSFHDRQKIAGFFREI